MLAALKANDWPFWAFAGVFFLRSVHARMLQCCIVTLLRLLLKPYRAAKRSPAKP
jgi:hypothetical protein